MMARKENADLDFRVSYFFGQNEKHAFGKSGGRGRGSRGGAQAQGAAGVALNRCFLRPTDDFLPES